MSALEREGQTFFFLESTTQQLVGAKEITSQRSVHTVFRLVKLILITKLSAVKL